MADLCYLTEFQTFRGCVQVPSPNCVDWLLGQGPRNNSGPLVICLFAFHFCTYSYMRFLFSMIIATVITSLQKRSIIIIITNFWKNKNIIIITIHHHQHQHQHCYHHRRHQKHRSFLWHSDQLHPAVLQLTAPSSSWPLQAANFTDLKIYMPSTRQMSLKLGAMRTFGWAPWKLGFQWNLRCLMKPELCHSCSTTFSCVIRTFNSQPLRKWRIVPRGSYIADEPGFLGISCQHVKSKSVDNLQQTTSILSVERGWTLARSWNEPRWAQKVIIECMHVFLYNLSITL